MNGPLNLVGQLDFFGGEIHDDSDAEAPGQLPGIASQPERAAKLRAAARFTYADRLELALWQVRTPWQETVIREWFRRYGHVNPRMASPMFCLKCGGAGVMIPDDHPPTYGGVVCPNCHRSAPALEIV